VCNVKRLLIKIVLLVLLVLLLVCTVFLMPVPYSDNLSAIINKRDLLKDGHCDRIVFIGGSGLFDGLDSNLVEVRLGRPVVNMGLYYGFGITPLLHEIMPYLHPGDTVVIIPEYGVAFDAPDEPARKWIFALDPALNWVLYRDVPDRVRSFVTDVIFLVQSKLRAFPKAVLEAVRMRSLTPLTRQGYAYYDKYYNAYGDSLRTMRAEPGAPPLRSSDIVATPAYNQPFTKVSSFCRDALQKGVETFFIFPAFPEEEYLRQEEEMLRYETRLRKELQCTVLGAPQDYLYPLSYFTNAVHHINNDARRIRTERLLKDLEHAMAGRTARQF